MKFLPLVIIEVGILDLILLIPWLMIIVLTSVWFRSTGSFKITYQLLININPDFTFFGVSGTVAIWTVISCSLADPLVVVVFFIVNLFLRISGVSLLTVLLSVFVLFLSLLTPLLHSLSAFTYSFQLTMAIKTHKTGLQSHCRNAWAQRTGSR